MLHNRFRLEDDLVVRYALAEGGLLLIVPVINTTAANGAPRRADGSLEGQDAAVQLLGSRQPAHGRASTQLPRLFKAGLASLLLFGAPKSTAGRLGQCRNGHRNQTTSVCHPGIGTLRSNRARHSRCKSIRTNHQYRRESGRHKPHPMMLLPAWSSCVAQR